MCLQDAQDAFMKVLDELTIADCVESPVLARKLLGLEFVPVIADRIDAA